MRHRPGEFPGYQSQGYCRSLYRRIQSPEARTPGLGVFLQPMSIRRQERVTELIHQEISKRIPLLKDPGLGFITVLAVRLSADFNLAKVYYSVLGSEEERSEE